MKGVGFDYHDILNSMFRRLVRLPERPRESFFLWGPRHTGKSTLLRALYPQARRIDLGKTEEFVRYGEKPSLLREEIEEGPRPPVVVIDEIQKVPPLYEEVRRLAEEPGCVFAMSGSSSRALRARASNRTNGGGSGGGGRMAGFDLFGLTSAEIGKAYDLVRM